MINPKHEEGQLNDLLKRNRHRVHYWQAKTKKNITREDTIREEKKMKDTICEENR